MTENSSETIPLARARELFEQLQRDDRARLQTRARRIRTAQLRDLLSEPDNIDLAQFNREVWRIHSEVTLDGQPTKALDILDKTSTIDPETLNAIDDALDDGRLEMHGNMIWGSGTRVYAAQLGVSDEEKLANVRRALTILGDPDLNPQHKAEQIKEIPGFGWNSATGLVMVFHPDSFALYNKPSQDALALLGYDVRDLASFQRAARELRDTLGAQDFIELDRLLFEIAQRRADLLPGSPLADDPVALLRRADRVWWVNQGRSYERELAQGCIFAEKTTKDGRSVPHRENVRHVRPGDVIVHYSSGAVRAISHVTSEPYDGERNGDTGWQADVAYVELGEPLPLNDIPETWRRDTDGPFNVNGGIKQSYLFDLDLAFARKFADLLAGENVSTENVSTEKNIWLFQANPDRFPLAERLQTWLVGHEDTWSVTRYRDDITPGDRVLLWQSGDAAGIYGLGEIVGDVYQDPERQHYTQTESPSAVRYRLDRAIDPPILRSDLQERPVLGDMHVVKNPQGTNFRVREDEWTVLKTLIDERTTNPVRAPHPVFTPEQIAEQSGLEPSLLARWLRSLGRKGQAILYGPPGTGKTFTADLIARHLVGGGDGLYETVQFHPAYAYEDFIQGLRPTLNNHGQLDYRLEPGRFLDFVHRARTRQGTSVLVIDEINRADLARVFGELMYLLEYRDQKVPLAGGGEEKFFIPENVRIIGTMNTADRSVTLIDHALRRRFAFWRLEPDYTFLRDYHQHTPAAPWIADLIKVLEEINDSIDNPDRSLGTSFFLTKTLDLDTTADIWQTEIEPYLEEIFFDRPDAIVPFRWERVSEQLGLNDDSSG